MATIPVQIANCCMTGYMTIDISTKGLWHKYYGAFSFLTHFWKELATLVRGDIIANIHTATNKMSTTKQQFSIWNHPMMNS